MKKWENFSKEQLKEFVEQSTSIAQVASLCGYAEKSGSGAFAIRQMIEYYNFDTSHFLDLNGSSEAIKKLDDQSDFVYGKAIKSEKMKNHLIHLRGHKCKKCGNTEWQGQLIPLEVHHIDGDRLNNVLENLQLLCPNCHAQTENYRNKNISIEKEKRNAVPDEDFVQALQTSKNIRQALLKLGLAAKGGNYTRANEIIAKYNIRLGELL